MSRRNLVEATARSAVHSRLPRPTVRLRLTLLYGTLFLASGVALLTITYVLAWNATTAVPGTAQGPKRALLEYQAQQHAGVMRQLLESCGIALAVAAVLSMALGWLVAGRVLQPLRTMTAATQRIGEQNLHQRLAIAGPDDELKQLGDTIDGLLARLEAAFAAQRRFVANASHELRTPLTMMRAALDVATSKPGPAAPGVTTLTERIRLGLDRAERLVESFLALARAQHGGALDAEVVALDRLAAAVVAGQRAAITGMHLTVEEDHQDAPAHGNHDLLDHLIGNLIDNAIRHNHPGGWIRIATSTGPGFARLVVENGGSVLDQGQVPGLAEPFRRLSPDRTTTRDTGTGLGLSIVAAIVTTHHGALDLQALPRGGLRVAVTLPLSAQPALIAGVLG
jgi:signal transduction histidine kinase